MPGTAMLGDAEQGKDMTTDPEEGQRQVEEANKPHEFKVGDKVRLKAAAGLGPAMTVIAVEDYGNQIVCEHEGPRDTYSRVSLERA